MKKYISIFMAFALIVILAGCSNYTYEENEIICKVLKCEEGEFIPNATYTVLATKALADGDATKWVLYNNLAKSTGKYEYKVTVNIEGKEYILTRDEPFKEGDEIVVKQKSSYCDGKLIETLYN